MIWQEWAEGIRAAWRPPEILRPSEWAQRNRVIRVGAIKGAWDNRNNPPLVGVMDLCVHRAVRELWVMKGVQVGASQGLRNVLGCWAEGDPDPTLIVLPSEEDGRRIFRKDILPLFAETEVLRGLGTGYKRDAKLGAISLANGFHLTLGYSGSPSSLASDPYRRVILDEPDKYNQTNANEAPPEDLARVRTTTYGERRLIVGMCTPTSRLGVIFREYDRCPTKLFYYCPCPKCGTFQRLLFERLKWTKPDAGLTPEQAASRVKRAGAAGTWYECAAVGCGHKIREPDRPSILWRGYWGTEDGKWKLWTDGSREEREWPGDDRVGVHFPSIYSLFVKWHELAAEFVAAGDDVGKQKAFRTQRLAEVWELQVAHSHKDVFQRKCRVPWPDKVVPPWASRIILVADTQKDHFWFVIRAWGWNFRSRRIHHGRVTSFEELAQLADATLWRYEGELGERYAPLPVYMSGIDSGIGKAGLDGSRTDEVYRWCEADPIRRKPLKGEADSLTPIRLRKHTYTPPGLGRNPYVVWLHLFSKTYFNDLLESAIGLKVHEVDADTGELLTGEDAPDTWELNRVEDPEYDQHLASMHKVADRKRELWLPRSAGARFDYRACEYMQFAMAHGPAMCGALPTADVLAAAHAARSAPPRKPATDRPDWMPQRPEGWTK